MEGELERKIRRLEAQQIGEKAWHLRGEVTARDRPKDSLLQAELEHDVALRPAPVITADTTQTLESIIAKRVVESKFDDVVERVPEEERDDEESRKKQKKAEMMGTALSAEKAKVGLAEMYEKEYVAELAKRKSALEQSEADVLEKALEAAERGRPEVMEVNELYGKLAAQLDALSSLHFAPKIPPVEPKTSAKERTASSGGVGVVNMEHAMPDSATNGGMGAVAAGEWFERKSRGTVAEAELSKDERAARRASKKRAGRAKRKRRRVESGEGDGRRLLSDVVERGRKGGAGIRVTTEKTDSSQRKSTKSSALFNQLQHSIRADIERKRLRTENQSPD